jgi:hypothetical protein
MTGILRYPFVQYYGINLKITISLQGCIYKTFQNCYIIFKSYLQIIERAGNRCV